jgi:hypothetical protein
LSTTNIAAARRDGLWLLQATSSGYISACSADAWQKALGT